MSQRLIDAELMPTQMMQKLDVFLHKIQVLSETLYLDLSEFQADHIALRINQSELAHLAHQEWLKFGKEISNTTINGRPIIVIQFNQPVKVREWQIECLELPFPAKGKIYPDQSWEHIEFVVPSQADTVEDYLLDIKRIFPEFARQYDHLTSKDIKVKLSSPKGEGERLNNPTVAFKSKEVCIKLHPYSLKKIVESEQIV